MWRKGEGGRIERGDLLSDGDIQGREGGRAGGREVRRRPERKKDEIHYKMYTSLLQGPPGTPGRNGVDGLPGLRGPKGMDVSGYLNDKVPSDMIALKSSNQIAIV